MHMKKRLLSLLLCLLCSVGLLTACSGLAGGGEESSQQPVLHMIRGTVRERDARSLTLDVDGTGYLLPLTDDTVIENTLSDELLPVNSTVSVSYYGDLLFEDGDTLQSVQVTKVMVERLPEDPALTKAKELLAAMTMEEKAGQMFIVRCPEIDGAALAEQYQVGGYILFDRDFADQTAETLQETVASYQDSVKIPLFIAVDEEGGTVVRASGYSQFRSAPFASPQWLYQEGGMDAIVEDAAEKSRFLLDLGINLNLAPVCDVSADPYDFIYDRAFGQDAEATADYAAQVTAAMKNAGIGSALKHFPGYGNNVDTHTGISYDNRPYEMFRTGDFLPFEAGIRAGANCVLVSHNIVACMDDEMPASLSAEVHQILREELGFAGIIMTDDLVMDAIREYTDNETAAVTAVLAGNDMICCTDFTEQIPAVIAAVEDGTIPESRLDESVLRILQEKIRLGIIS